MKEKSLNTLEFPKIRERLAAFCSFAASREMALGLLPSSKLEEGSRRHKAVAEGYRLMDMKPGFSVAAHDVRPAVTLATKGGLLDPQALLELRATLASGRDVRSTITRLERDLPLLSEVARRITDLPHLERGIGRCIGPRGEVLDTASPVLKRLRQELKLAHDRLVERLNEIVASPKGRVVLQESFVTLRNGRYVLPVRAEQKGELKGIVHDVSDSGATLFIEPLAAVEMGNSWRELQVAEEKEKERILRRLSSEVAEAAQAILENIEALAEIDFALAKARFGLSLKATQPELISNGPLTLIDARHPLITGSVVPISIEIGDSFSIMVITGPNTGGKTVALKTMGLLTLMALAGLPIPAGEGSRIPFFDGVYADIGDEQSIEQSLSTFSSHMGNIIQILREATDSSLVLLDELGAGTDPVEGSALGRAILSYLLGRGAITIATTHHSALKTFAHATAGVRNAAVEFDAETLAPTYRLSIGLPGQSNAMAIASHLGLSEEIIEGARGMLVPAMAEAEGLLAEIRREREQAAAQRLALEATRIEAEGARQRLEERLRDIEEEKRGIVEEARRQIAEEVAALRERLRRVASLVEDRERLAAAARELRVIGQEAQRWRRPEAKPWPELRPGTAVWVASLNREGELLTPPDAEGMVEVRVGALKARVRADGLKATAEASAALSSVVVPHPSPPSLELHLRGWRADEVEPELDRYLNDAFLSGMPCVRIVHGKGTGTLRRLVREKLAGHPLVKSFSSAETREGGEGVTIAQLAV